MYVCVKIVGYIKFILAGKNVVGVAKFYGCF